MDSPPPLTVHVYGALFEIRTERGIICSQTFGLFALTPTPGCRLDAYPSLFQQQHSREFWPNFNVVLLSHDAMVARDSGVRTKHLDSGDPEMSPLTSNIH